MKAILARTFLLLIGFFLGCLFDLVPTYVEETLNISSCSEGCPSWIQASAIFLYLLTPFALSFALAWMRTVRQWAVILLLLALAHCSLAWLSHAYQIGLLRRILSHF
ncbi:MULTISPECIES: hypothetical protein [Cupriavidus]|uniref:Transmembrane protein n=1 Tax=Cupriavidus pinatubonensis (strain JMP 134 / LMG 1197) TaxID=264198 RepID=Q475K1_CUPPJ|nr:MULTISPECIES: hypothetical protein [Cupriavidus]QYY32151.1 hypothetical protein K2O51_15245 [Cupriavidus pinatubonensis]TPQ35526.1 hypothetical protein C2U69_20700 [Cupriavidus pinatubonensis]